MRTGKSVGTKVWQTCLTFSSSNTGRVPSFFLCLSFFIPPLGPSVPFSWLAGAKMSELSWL